MKRILLPHPGGHMMPNSDNSPGHTRDTHTIVLVFYIIGIILGAAVVLIVLGQL